MIKKEDIWKITFKIIQGPFEWFLLPFGLCKAPIIFMRVINEFIYLLIDSFVDIYLDDIIMYSSTWEENLVHLRYVLKTLQKEKFYYRY